MGGKGPLRGTVRKRLMLKISDFTNRHYCYSFRRKNKYVAILTLLMKIVTTLIKLRSEMQSNKLINAIT